VEPQHIAQAGLSLWSSCFSLFSSWSNMCVLLHPALDIYFEKSSNNLFS
jgi:hypothetical protein